jgi:branched-chain amino acid transport system permease protein
VSVQFFLQQCLIGLTNGALIALVALGYTMVYGIIGLINFAHGDLITLGACLALTLVTALGLGVASPASTWLGIVLLVAVCGLFCGTLNVCVDRIVYKPLRTFSPPPTCFPARGCSSPGRICSSWSSWRR